MRSKFALLFAVLVLINISAIGAQASSSGGHEEGGSTVHAEVGAMVGSGYERFSVISADEAAYTGFAGIGLQLGGGWHAGVHGLMATTADEEFEREVSVHGGLHTGHFNISAAYNSVNHVTHDLITPEAQLGIGYSFNDHYKIDLLANLELDHEERNYYEAIFSYHRGLSDHAAVNVAAKFGYLVTDGVAASHDTVSVHRTDKTEETASHNDTSFSGVHRGSLKAGVDLTPGAVHGLTITGSVESIFPLSDDAKTDIELRSFDGKTSSIVIAGIQIKYGF